jgi:hypothetical protein
MPRHLLTGLLVALGSNLALSCDQHKADAER